jgi:hypothetical protein
LFCGLVVDGIDCQCGSKIWIQRACGPIKPSPMQGDSARERPQGVLNATVWIWSKWHAGCSR